MPKIERIVATGEKLVKLFSLEHGKEYVLEMEIGSKYGNLPMKDILLKLSNCVDGILRKIDYILHLAGIEPIILIDTEIKDNFIRIHFKK